MAGANLAGLSRLLEAGSGQLPAGRRGHAPAAADGPQRPAPRRRFSQPADQRLADSPRLRQHQFDRASRLGDFGAVRQTPPGLWTPGWFAQSRKLHLDAATPPWVAGHLSAGETPAIGLRRVHAPLSQLLENQRAIPRPLPKADLEFSTGLRLDGDDGYGQSCGFAGPVRLAALLLHVPANPDPAARVPRGL